MFFVATRGLFLLALSVPCSDQDDGDDGDDGGDGGGDVDDDTCENVLGDVSTESSWPPALVLLLPRKANMGLQQVQ